MTFQPVCEFLWFRVLARIGGARVGFGRFFVCFPNLSGMSALMDVSLETLCQNYDKFMFCG